MDGIQIKKLGLVTFEGGATAFGGVATFGGSLLSGFTCGHKKLTLISGGGGGATFGASLLSELYGNILDFYIQKIENFRSLET